MKILINGNFLNRNLTGIERFAWETCARLDKMLEKDDDFSILAAKNASRIPEYKNIKIIRSQKEIRGFPKWDLKIFRKECRKNRAVGLNFSNTAPRGKNAGLCFIHDIYASDCPQDFSTFKDRLIRAYSTWCYKNIAENALHVFTVSEFSKKRICERYKIPPEKITVIPNGWEHFKDIQSDEKIFNRFPALKEKEFYFTLGSLSRRKNLAWIARYAQEHPSSHFAVSGKAISGLLPPELENLRKLPNVTLAGYITDEEVKALMKKCRAFVFPSYYEGFGIPPLEALSTGCQAVVSEAACLPEIYGKAVHYINPDSTDVNLDKLLEEKVDSPDGILSRYTYENAARLLLEKIRKLALVAN